MRHGVRVVELVRMRVERGVQLRYRNYFRHGGRGYFLRLVSGARLDGWPLAVVAIRADAKEVVARVLAVEASRMAWAGYLFCVRFAKFEF